MRPIICICIHIPQVPFKGTSSVRGRTYPRVCIGTKLLYGRCRVDYMSHHHHHGGGHHATIGVGSGGSNDPNASSRGGNNNTNVNINFFEMPRSPDASKLRIFVESFLPSRFNEMFQTFLATVLTCIHPTWPKFNHNLN